MNIKKTAFGTAAVAALVIAGASPALAASDQPAGQSKWYSTSTQKTTSTDLSVDVLGGGILNGDNLNGNAVGSGNDTPIASGNETTAPVLSGNDTAVGNVTGNDVSGNGSGNLSGNDVSDVVDNTTDIQDVVDNATDTSVGDIVDVQGIVDDVTGAVNLEGLLGR